MSGPNNYTDITVIQDDSTLTLKSNGSIANSSTVMNYGIFSINANSSIVSLYGDGNVNLGNRTLTLSNADDTFSGIISGVGGNLVIDNSGTEVLSGENTYTGSTIIHSGANLTLDTGGSIKNSRVINDGIFNILTDSSIVSLGSSSPTSSVNLNAYTLTLSNATDTFSGIISGTGGLTIRGGCEALSGTSTYAGDTLINNYATLALTGNGSIASSSGVYLGGWGGALFDISGITGGTSTIKTIGSISSINRDGNNNIIDGVNLGNKILVLSAANSLFSGVIFGNTGTGGLTIDSGSEALAGVNTYTGPTTINNGATLALYGSGSIADSSAVINNGTIDLTSSTSDTINFGGTYTQSSTGKVVIASIGNAFQHLIIAGSATIDGILYVYDSYKQGHTNKKSTIFTATGGITGMFSSFESNIRTPYRATFSHDTNNIYLTIVPPNYSYTLQSVQQNVQGLSTAINMHSAAIQIALSYDCDRFDKYGLCVKVGGRRTSTNAVPLNRDQTGFVVVGYSPARNARFGIFADQSFNTAVSSTITREKAGSPILGFFGHWNLNDDGNGLGFHASAAFADNILSISRVGVDMPSPSLIYSEPGQGNTKVRSKGCQIQANYTQPIDNRIKAIPFVGLRYVSISNGAYTEDVTDSVYYPLSYNDLTQDTSAALAGLGISSQFTENLSGSAVVGVQQNLDYKIGNYAGTSQNPDMTNFNIQMPSSRKTLATASANLFYDIMKIGLLGLNLSWQQQPFDGTSTTTVLATYTVKM